MGGMGEGSRVEGGSGCVGWWLACLMPDPGSEDGESPGSVEDDAGVSAEAEAGCSCWR